LKDLYIEETHKYAPMILSQAYIEPMADFNAM